MSLDGLHKLCPALLGAAEASNELGVLAAKAVAALLLLYGVGIGQGHPVLHGPLHHRHDPALARDGVESQANLPPVNCLNDNALTVPLVELQHAVPHVGVIHVFPQLIDGHLEGSSASLDAVGLPPSAHPPSQLVGVGSDQLQERSHLCPAPGWLVEVDLGRHRASDTGPPLGKHAADLVASVEPGPGGHPGGGDVGRLDVGHAMGE